MSYKSLVQQQVNLAFKAIGDLKTEVSFVSQGEQTYNPTTGEVSSATTTTAGVMGVILSTESSVTDGTGGMPIVVMEVLFNKEDLPEDYGNFDTVELQGSEHKVINFKDDSYTVTLTLSKR